VTSRSLVGALLIAVSCGEFEAVIALNQASTLSKSGECWRDYAFPAPSVNYERAFALETLAPELIALDSRVVKAGMAEKELNEILGVVPSTVENAGRRTEQEQCEYLSGLLRDHPNSMHLYVLGALKLKKMSGSFRVSEWQIPAVGTLRVFFHNDGVRPETSYLFHLTLLPTPPETVTRNKGRGYVLVRIGPPRIEWDVDTNRVSIARAKRLEVSGKTAGGPDRFRIVAGTSSPW
jgi:hypothetical protein